MSATAPTIAQQIAELKVRNAEALPAEVGATFTAEQRELGAAGIPAGVLSPGAPMPDGALLDAHGGPTTLAAARAGAPAVVVLYRGAWCPYCSLTLRAYEAQLFPALRERGVALIAISPQKPDRSLKTAELNELTYTVVSDPGNQIASALGVLFTPSEEARAAQRELGLDTTEVNADGGPGLPMPTVAVVDAGGTLGWLDVRPDYATRTEPAAIIEAVEAL